MLRILQRPPSAFPQLRYSSWNVSKSCNEFVEIDRWLGSLPHMTVQYWVHRPPPSTFRQLEINNFVWPAFPSLCSRRNIYPRTSIYMISSERNKPDTTLTNSMRQISFLRTFGSLCKASYKRSGCTYGLNDLRTVNRSSWNVILKNVTRNFDFAQRQTYRTFCMKACTYFVLISNECRSTHNPKLLNCL